MARELVIGNGGMLLALDHTLKVRDFYYPAVGAENHLAGHPLRTGLWVDGKFSWLGEGWQISLRYLPDTQVGAATAANADLELELETTEAVHFKANLYLKKIVVRNLKNSFRECGVFLSHDFHLYGVDTGDTAFFDPALNSIMHYKGKRHFLISGLTEKGLGMSQFAVGTKESFGLEGTWKDAEDGVLSGNPIAQGSVDSVVCFNLSLPPRGTETLYYWIACAENNDAAETLHQQAVHTGVEQLLLETENYWSAWVNKRNLDLSHLPREIARLFKTSLLVMRTHVDNSGAVIASGDSDLLKFNRDTYAYVWPRDGAIAALAFDAAGFEEISRRFFEFCDRVLVNKGYFYHKYTPKGSLGSSWHPLVDPSGRPQLPIQEDETALVLYALWNHFQKFRDVEFIARVYPNLVLKTSNFLLDHIDATTGLPRPSFDIWEERFGTFTATAATVQAALSAAAKFAMVFYDSDRHKTLSLAAERMKQAIQQHLYNQEKGSFLKAVYPDGRRDETIDSSLAFIFDYGVLPVSDPGVVSTMERLEKTLWVATEIGGMARYENDDYYRISAGVPGNPWFICTLWLAKWHIARAATLDELKASLKYLNWAVRHASRSGIIGEQINPNSGQSVSVSPLTWSHAEFVLAVSQYLEKYKALESG